MRKAWTLPAESLLYDSGPEWLLHIVGTADVEEVARLMLILWRACIGLFVTNGFMQNVGFGVTSR